MSNTDANIVLTDIDATNCASNPLIGNQATDNADGYSIRGVYLNNVFVDKWIEISNAINVSISGGSVTGVKLRSKCTNVDISPSLMRGDGTSGTYNCPIYLYANAIVSNIKLSAFTYQSMNSYYYAEVGASIIGPMSANDLPVNPAGMSFKLNSVLYTYVDFRSGRSDRDMGKQSWFAFGKPFYATDKSKYIAWNGTSLIDMNGTVVV